MDCIGERCPQGPFARLEIGKDVSNSPQIIGRNMDMLLVAKCHRAL